MLAGGSLDRESREEFLPSSTHSLLSSPKHGKIFDDQSIIFGFPDTTLTWLRYILLQRKRGKFSREPVVQSEIQLWTELGSKILAFGFGDHPGGERMSRDNLSSITHLKYARERAKCTDRLKFEQTGNCDRENHWDQILFTQRHHAQMLLFLLE